MKRRSFLKGVALAILAPGMLFRQEEERMLINGVPCYTQDELSIGGFAKKYNHQDIYDTLDKYEDMERESARISILEEMATDIDNIARGM